MAYLGAIVPLAHFYSSFIAILGFTCVCALDYENEYGPEYGNDWILFMDDNGTTHTLNFSSLPVDIRGMLFGDAYFYLYTRRNNEAEILTIPDNDAEFISQYFNSSYDVKIITHGWLSSESTGWLQKIKNSFLENDDYNIITVDWGELADNPIYPWSAFSTRYVGRRLSKLITAIQNTHKIAGENFHLIGHSLGAHVMGYAGMFSEHPIRRITGLDPARPLFEIPRMGNDFRLEKSDANFVDIIHTCGGIYGYKYSHGHADFYPNGGKAMQPGCEGRQNMIEACSHGRSVEFFEESINCFVPFVAYPCESWEKFKNDGCRDNSSLMGLFAVENHLGDYYLNTKAESKYAMGTEK